MTARPPFVGAHARAVVIESDDWGLCAWVPDEAAAQRLAHAPAFRTPAGRRYGRSTLERADEVRALHAVLRGIRGADGQTAVLQANTVMAAPDYARIDPARAKPPLPTLAWPALPSRWARPGLADALAEAQADGTWWPELHGLHHLPERAWTRALARGTADARAAFAEQCCVCADVEGSGEFAASEPLAERVRRLEQAVAAFTQRFGRGPGSFCPPDYRWDAALDAAATRLGLDTFQGMAERATPFGRLGRALRARRRPALRGGRFELPARIAFEPLGRDAPDAPLGVDDAHHRCRRAWARGTPAVLSTHRLNYAHLDAGFAAAGRRGLAMLLARLAEDGAVFLVDVELRGLLAHGWSQRPLGADRVLVRCVASSTVPVEAPDGAGVRIVAGDGDVGTQHDRAVARLGPGVHVLAWGAR